MTTKMIVIRFGFVLGLFSILICGSQNTSATPQGSASVYLPVAINGYESWSTNFANVTDPATAEIYDWFGGQLSIDTTNVNSGGKSIKDYVTMDAQHGNLQTAFSVHGLTGQDSLDLSDKILSVEIYVPSDPPFQFLGIELNSGNDHMDVRVNTPPRKGQWYTYQVDLKMVRTLGSWRYYDWMHSPGIASDADALNLLKHVQFIQIIGGNPNRYGDAYLLIDRLGWESSEPLPAYNPAVDSLRKYADARNMPIGTFFGLDAASDPAYMGIVLQQFSIGVASFLDWPANRPTGYNFDAFAQVPQDIFMDHVAERLGYSPLTIRYLVYMVKLNTPDWLITDTQNLSYPARQTILENYVRARVNANKGKTKIWYVFNELLRGDIGWVPYTGLGLKDRNQSPSDEFPQYSPFSDSPSDVTMIEAAFCAARATDPDAWLFLLDGGVEEIGHAKPDAFYDLAKKLVDDHTPIDGVGLQAHLIIGPDGKVHANSGGDYALAFDVTNGLTGIAANVERYQALGLKVAFSEVDVPIYTADTDSSPAGQQRLAERQQVQAEVYRSLLHIALTHSNVVAFNMQAWADEYTYIGRDPGQASLVGFYGDLGLFDIEYQPKVAYYALLDELKGSALPGPFLKAIPLDDAGDQSAYPTLSWTASWSATSYEYCLDDSANNICDTSWISTGTHISVTLSSLAVGTTYDWQVRARNAAGVTDADLGNWRSFTVVYERNLALDQPATASSCENDPCTTPAEYVVDGDYATRWSSAWSDPQWVQVDLGDVYDIDRVVLNWEAAYATAYQIQVSTNGTDWTTIYSTTEGNGGADYLNLSGSGRYIRMYGTQRVEIGGSRYGYSLWEFEVYGSEP